MPAPTFYKLHDPALEIASDIARRGRFVMARKLKGFVATLEEVDQKYRELYVEEPDPADAAKVRFRLDADEVQDVTGLKRTVATLRTDLNAAKAKAKPLEEIAADEDVDEIITAGRAAIEAKRTGRPVPEVEAATKALTTKHEKALGVIKAENEGLMTALRESVIEGGASAAIAELKGNKTLLMPHVKGIVDIVRVVDGDKIRYEPRVFEGTGSSRTERTDAAGKPITIKAAVAELRANDDFADAFVGSVVPGSGTPAAGSGGMPTPPGRSNREAATPAAAAKDAKRQTMDYSL